MPLPRKQNRNALTPDFFSEPKKHHSNPTTNDNTGRSDTTPQPDVKPTSISQFRNPNTGAMIDIPDQTWETPVPDHGYPKGMGHGPRTWIWSPKKGELVKAEGIPFEKLPIKVAEMLDNKPVDDYGNLRIFMNATHQLEGAINLPYYEIGSIHSVSSLHNDLRRKQNAIFNSGADLSITNRPQNAVDTEQKFPDIE